MRPRNRRVARVAAAVTALVVVKVALRDRMLRWGSTPAERHRTLPGDERITDVAVCSTRAISIDAPPERVWPWIAQLGQGRGGFYSYDALENLLGLDIHSADEIVAEWQDLQVGDEVHLAEPVALEVVQVDPGRALVLDGAVPVGEAAAAAPYSFTWAFVLEHGADGGTRLVVRERYGYERWWAFLVVEPVGVASFVMSRRMLHGIKARAERT